MKKIYLILAGIITVSCLMAQVAVREENFTPTGVSNDGMVVGYYGQASSYFLWNTESDDMKEIGGISAGNGFGGMMQFSADGKYLSGSMLYDMPVSTEWTKTSLKDCIFTFTDMTAVPKMDEMLFAVGKDPEDDTKGILISTSNGGINWKQTSVVTALESVCFLTDNVGLIGGKNGSMFVTTSRGNGWSAFDPRPEGSEDQVITYHAIDFTHEEPYYGVVAAELADGGYAVYQSPDGAETWTEATGMTGIPLCATHVEGEFYNSTFYIGTKNGRIMKSTDNGLTWSLLYDTAKPLSPLSPIRRIGFSPDGQKGIAASDYCVYMTTDGGATWDYNSISEEVPVTISWNDVRWFDNNHVVVVGSKGQAYHSEDGGATWAKINAETDNTIALMTVAKTNSSICILGADGNSYRRSLIDKMESMGYMGRYNIETDEWTPLGDLGFYDQAYASGGYAISGDGKTVVGLSRYSQPDLTRIGASAHASAWNEDAGFIDLGSLYDNTGRSTRANAVSYDGSVIVGWQDQNGPWHSAVWRKNEEGGYGPNEYILIDPDGDDWEGNYPRQCSAVSLDGKWIGGYGSSINSGPLFKGAEDDDSQIANQPWIWSEEDGFKRLGMPAEFVGNTVAVANVTGINNDGTTVVGFITVGNTMYAFIWTEDGGIKTLNDYMANVLNYNMDNYQLCSILSMSPNGRYITGWGINNQTMSIMSFQIDLLMSSGIKNPGAIKNTATVYPNPVSDVLHIDMSVEGNTSIRLFNTQGQLVLTQKGYFMQNSINVENIPAGIYILDVTCEDMHKTYKIKVNH